MKAQRTSLGAEAPGFNVKNVYGHTVSLDSFPQRYLLLAFYGSLVRYVPDRRSVFWIRLR